MWHVLQLKTFNKKTRATFSEKTKTKIIKNAFELISVLKR